MKRLIFALAFLASPALADNQTACLALNVYHEARGESLEGRLAVAHVTLNRVRSSRFPNTICEVVKQGKYENGHPVKHMCQFSWWCDGKRDYPDNKEEFYKIWHEVVNMLYKKPVDITNGALFYHADYVNPHWAQHKQRTVVIGRHIFYAYQK